MFIEHLLCTRLCARLRIRQDSLCLQDSQFHVKKDRSVLRRQKARERKTNPSVSCQNVASLLVCCDHCPLRYIQLKKNFLKRPPHLNHSRSHMDSQRVNVLLFGLSPLALVSFPQTTCSCFVPCLLYGTPLSTQWGLHRTPP